MSQTASCPHFSCFSNHIVKKTTTTWGHFKCSKAKLYADSNWPCAQGVDAPLAGSVDCCHNNRAGTGMVWSHRASAGAAATPGRWSMWRCICGNGIPGPEGGVTAWSGWPPVAPHAPLMEEEERERSGLLGWTEGRKMVVEQGREES